MKLLRGIVLFVFICLMLGCTTMGDKYVELHGYTVKSWEQLAISELSTIVESARNNSESWVSLPALYPQYLFKFHDLRNYSIRYSAQSIESNRKSTIIVVRDGFLDDSIRGDIHELVVEKIEGQWEIKNAKRAFRCWRGPDSAPYSVDTCP